MPPCPGTPKIEFPESIEVNPSDTLEGELNKLAANIAIVRNGAGVHYRTDYTKSMALGEAVAAAVLQEKAQTFADVDPAMVLTWPNFDGHWVCINAAGKLRAVRRRPNLCKRCARSGSSPTDNRRP